MNAVRVPTWVYRMMIGMAALFVVIGAVEYAFTREPISSAALPLVGIGIGIGFGIALVRRNSDDRVERSGTTASATVLAVRATATRIDDVPKWRLTLRIQRPDRPYEAAIELLTFAPPAVGTTCGVRYDPAKPDHVVLADAPDDEPPAMPSNGERDAIDVVKTLTDLDRMRRDGQLSPSEFDRLKRGLLDAS